MKKPLITLVSVILLVIIIVYVLFPATPNLSYTVSLRGNPYSMSRYLDTKKPLKDWWSFTDSSYSYRNARQFPLLKEIIISHHGFEQLSTLLIKPVAGKSDSIDLTWQLIFDGRSYNPIQRIKNYHEAEAMKDNAVKVLDSMKRYFRTEDTYGINIHEATITDSILLTKKQIFYSYPSTDSIYRLYKELEKVIRANGAVQTGNPLLNVTRMVGDKFQATAALPINKLIPGNKDFQTRKMLNGIFLIAEVRGGASSVENALLELQYYFLDHNRTMMAMPFQILITDRSAEPDSTKWITQVYVPTY